MKKQKKIVIGNWKMQLTLRESVVLAKDIVKKIPERKRGTDVVVCPSFTALPSVHSLLTADITLGAQDVFWSESGAYTGAIAPRFLTEVGCRYVIIGHSERRQYCGETDAMVQKKLAAALHAELTPVLCVGENAEERRNGQKDYVVMRQVTEAIRGVTLVGKQALIIAYEPVWVIGTGQAVPREDAEHMAHVIRHTIADVVPPATMEERCRIVYGGSVDGKNVTQFTQSSVIDGVLVGGASLKAQSFATIVGAVDRAV